MAAKYLLTLLPALLLQTTGLAQNGGWAILKTFPIHSNGGWDYLTVSPLNNHLYVSHGTQVNILDRTNGDSVGIITGTAGVHGITFAPELGKGFISNGRLNNVYVFDGHTDRVTDSIPTGTGPDAMCYDERSGRLIVGNGRSKDLTVINAKNNTVAGTVPLGGTPEAGVSNGRGQVYINVEDKNEVAVLDAASLKITARYPLKGGEEPTGIAYDRKTETLFVGCGNKELVVLDARTGRQKGLLPIGDHCDGVALDGSTGDVFAANGEGTLTVVHGDKSGKQYSVIATISTKRSARTLALDARTHLVYLPAADFGPAASAKERPRPIPGSFGILVVGKP